MKLLATSFASLILVFSLHARDFATPPDAEKVPPPATKVSIILSDSNEKTLTIRVHNVTGKPFVYSGYSKQSPIFMVKEIPMGWCGTGVSQQTLAPGESITFQVSRRRIAADIREIHVSLGDTTSDPIPVK